MLGIVAAVAIPNFMTAKQRADQKRTLADIRSVGTLIETYGRDNNDVYPRAESMAELESLLPAGSVIPLLDAWGNDLRYGCTDEQCKGYAITSSGADRIFEHVYASEYPRDTTTNFDCDIVYVNGEFLQYPREVSR